MSGKTNKQFFFEVELNWLEGKKGILSAKDASGTIHVATPAKFGGEGNLWSPEHLFLSAISSCFMTTFLEFAQQLFFEISRMECEVIGQIELIEGKYKFTTINLYPRIYIENEALREKANQAVEKTHKYCLITHSINADVFYHTQVLRNPLSIATDENKVYTRETSSNRSAIETNY